MYLLKFVASSLVSFAVLAAVSTTTAQVVLVNFGGDYVTANQSSPHTQEDFLNTPGADNSIRQIGGFATTANPAMGATYAGPAFRAGVQAVKYGLSSPSGAARIAVNESGSSDFIALFAQTPGITSMISQNLNYVLNWSVNTTYGALTTVSVSLGALVANTAGTTTSRFLIETSSGAYYLSNLSWTGGDTTQTLALPATETWAQFTPNLSGDWSGNFASLPVFSALAAGTEIAGIGVFANRPGETTLQFNAQYNVTAFNVTAAAVPEPSAFAALAGLLALGLAATRRSRRV